MRQPVRVLTLTVALATLATTVVACTGSSKPNGESARRSASEFAVTKVDVQSPASPPPAMPDPVRDGVVGTLNRYLDSAVFAPLRSGRPASDLSPIFTAGASSRLGGTDRVAIVDEGLPRSDEVRADTASATLTALAISDSDIPLVTAGIELELVTGSGADAITIKRSGNFVLVQDGGTWKIDGYDIRVSRDTSGGMTTTSAHR